MRSSDFGVHTWLGMFTQIRSHFLVNYATYIHRYERCLTGGGVRMGAKKSRTFLRGTVQDDSNFFGTNYFCVTQVLTSKQSRYLASLGREEVTFSGPDSLCGLYVCIPKQSKMWHWLCQSSTWKSTNLLEYDLFEVYLVITYLGNCQYLVL